MSPPAEQVGRDVSVFAPGRLKLNFGSLFAIFFLYFCILVQVKTLKLQGRHKFSVIQVKSMDFGPAS